MKHICFISGRFPRYESIYFERHCPSLINAGYYVTSLVCDTLPNEIINGINIVSTNVRCDNLIHNRFKRMWIANQTLKHWIKNCPADIYHLNDPELIPLARHLKKKGLRVVFHVREPYLFDFRKSISSIKLPMFSSIMCVLFKIYLRNSFDKFDLVFAVSDDKQELRHKFGIKDSQLLTNFPIVNVDYNLPKSDYMNRKDTLGYFGAIYTISRQENVFAALEEIPEMDYLLAGVFGDFVGPYEMYIKSLPYWQKVNFMGRFSKSELPVILSQVTICNTLRDFSEMALPNGSLGVIKIFESMEAALPVLFSDVPLYRNIVAKYNCGICVDPNNAKEIENAIRYLLEHKEEAWQMGQNARKAIMDEYNWGKPGKKLH